LCDQIKNNEMDGALACMGERRGAYRVSVEKRKGKRPLARPRSRWEGNIKIDLQEVEAWTDLCQDRDSWRGNF
jgi:hypothetical protein